MPFYRPLRQPSHDSDGDAEESACFISDKDADAVRPSGRSKRMIVVLTALLVLSNIASLVFGAVAGRRSAYTRGRLDAKCAAHTTHASPLLRDVPISYHDVRFNGSFLQESVYRRPGAPDVDAAWEALGVDYRAGVISAADAPLSGLTPGHVQRADKYGGGYFVNVEGMHHLHCLNLVRKSLYYNYAYYHDLGEHAFRNDAHVLQLHVGHCVDILRQVLMCNVDTAVLGQVWYRTATPAAPGGDRIAAFPDFYTTHSCKNYDAVRQWAEQLQAPPLDQLPPDYIKAADPDAIRPSTP